MSYEKIKYLWSLDEEQDEMINTLPRLSDSRLILDSITIYNSAITVYSVYIIVLL